LIALLPQAALAAEAAAQPLTDYEQERQACIKRNKEARGMEGILMSCAVGSTNQGGVQFTLHPFLIHLPLQVFGRMMSTPPLSQREANRPRQGGSRSILEIDGKVDGEEEGVGKGTPTPGSSPAMLLKKRAVQGAAAAQGACKASSGGGRAGGKRAGEGAPAVAQGVGAPSKKSRLQRELASLFGG
jgi:hypothetical protein